MLILVEGAKKLRACVWELKYLSWTKSPKEQTKHRTTNINVVAEQEIMERAEHTARIAQLGSHHHELKAKLEFLERHNHVTYLRYSLLVDECDLI